MRLLIAGIVILAASLLLGWLIWARSVPNEIALQDVDNYEFVAVRATGQDLDTVNLHVESSKHGFDLMIPAGTLLISGGVGYQNMMVSRSVVVSFRDASQPLTQDIQLDAYCVNLHLDIPSVENVFTIGSYEPQDPLVAFVRCLENGSEEKDIRQIAVWIMSDNPTWNEFISRDSLDMVFNRDALRVLLSELFGIEPTAEQLDALMEEYKNIPDDELVEQLKPGMVPSVLKARQLFEECNVETGDRYLFRDLDM